MAKLRTAVIGCGAVSRNHGKALKDNEYADLLYAVDIDFEKAKTFAETYGGEPIQNYKDLCGKIDVAHVVTPHNTHPTIAKDLMRQGINVFCEKPLAITVAEAEEMVKVSREEGVRLGVCFQNRMNKASVEAKEIIDAGKYGKIVSGMVLVAWDRHGAYYSQSPWRGKYKGEGGGVVINQAIHTLDLLDYLSGGVESLSAFDAKLRDTDDYEVEDSAMILFNLKCGATAVGYCTNCYPLSKTANLELHLEKATLNVNQGGLRIEEEGGNVIFHKAETLTGYKSEWGVSHGALINEYYRTLLSGEKFIADAETGLAAVRIVGAIQHSKGKIMRIAP